MDKNKKSVFKKIAPLYGLFYDYQEKYYSKLLNLTKSDFDITIFKNIIDIGCGTGALCSVLNRKGLTVTGVDLEQKMINIALRRNKNSDIKFLQGNVLDNLPFEDKAFDISIASLVAHGLQSRQRKIMYQQMSRITKKYVIIHDYNDNRSPFINIIEWLEGGDYFQFIKNCILELKEIFQDVKIIKIGSHISWYICLPNI